MFNFIVKGLSRVFGNKSDRDVKSVQPLAAEINRHFATYSSLSHNELRGKTVEFRNRIAEYLAPVDQKLDELKAQLQSTDMDLQEKERIYKEVDLVKKERDQELEKVLMDILPEAFAVVKETARRFSENPQLEVQATEFDRNLAARKDFVKIQGDKALWQNHWMAAGNEVIWNMVHYDVQLIGGVVLHQGKISEMATGEGKTLVSTLPAYLNAISGEGVHIVTVNDYLARRDCEWNGPLFQFHGISVDCIDYHQPNSTERRKAYLADITYGTNNEFGFDYLRDNMARDPEDLVQRKHHFAMVDEVDSVLVDDARTPLIISGPVPRGDDQQFFQLKPRIEKLVELQKRYLNTALADAKRLLAEKKEDEGGLALLRAHRGLPKNKTLIKYLGESGIKAILQKTENYYMQDQQREMHKVDAELYFVIDEKHNSIELTEKGIEQITSSGEDPHFFLLPDVGSEIAEIEKSQGSDEDKRNKKDQLLRDFSIKSERIHTIQQLLKAYTLFELDVEYVVMDAKVKIVDEQTGRILEGRRYSDGLHQAIEAKENVKVEAATQTYATITLQNYFRMYHKLAGMTGTAETEAGELWEIYKLDVVVIPTNRSIIRKDADDKVYKTKREKYNAVIDEVGALVEQGRPVLVGTTSVEVSELLSRMLNLRKIKHNVLNAKQHQREAEIVAEAGRSGTVTIATNMAGRGTDIKLGPGVKESGGLAIVGTERHESRRVDRQLRGRSGRQGDPGSTQFFVSLEDDLMRLFGSERISKVMDKIGIEEGEVIQHPLITRNIERAQKKVEQNNFGIRKRLLEYDDVMNSQREVIYNKRKNALFGDKLALDIDNMIFDLSEELVLEYTGNYADFKLEILRLLAHETQINAEEFKDGKPEELSRKLYEELLEHYTHKNQVICQEALPVVNNVYETQGSQIEMMGIPISDGIRVVQVGVNLKKAYETKGQEIIHAYERFVSLALIDDEWKEHLREMDDLKQSVQNAALEQKDPLLIYKLESFNLFKAMLARVNKEVLSMLFKGVIAAKAPDNYRQPAPMKPRQDSRIQTRRNDEYNQPEAQVANANTQEPQKPQQVKGVVKVGRNDPCPCGSGKKYKQCHGKEEMNA